jgi:hypothetical protein
MEPVTEHNPLLWLFTAGVAPGLDAEDNSTRGNSGVAIELESGSAALADFVVNADLPPAARERAAAAICDTAGVILAGAVEPASRMVRAMVTEEGRGECRILGTREVAGPGGAALANGVAGHALDYRQHGQAAPRRHGGAQRRDGRAPRAARLSVVGRRARGTSGVPRRDGQPAPVARARGRRPRSAVGDLLIQSEVGLLAVTGTEEEPCKVGVSIADIAAGMYAYSGILTALLARKDTGRGTAVDVSLFDALGECMGVIS